MPSLCPEQTRSEARFPGLALALGLYGVSSLISMATMSVGTVIVVFAMLIYFRGPRGVWDAMGPELHGKFGKTYGIASLALAGACILSLLCGQRWPLSFGGHFSQVHFWRDSAKLWYLFWPLLLVAALRALEDRSRQQVLRAWFLAFGILSSIGILQFWTGWPRKQVIPEIPSHFHASLFLGFHLAVASILIFPFFAALDFARLSLKQKIRPLGWPGWVWIVMTLAGLITLFLTYSRTLWVALPMGLALWGFLSLSRKHRWILLSVLVLAAACLSGLPSVRSRFSLSLTQFSVATRADLWRANLAMFSERPWTGVGWLHNNELSGYYLMEKLHSNDVFSGHAHNDVLDVLGGTGAIGLIAWLFWCGVVLWLSLRVVGNVSGTATDRSQSQVRLFGFGIFCAWIVFQLNGMTQLNFWDAKVTHQMMWVTAWLLYEAKCKRAPEVYPEF